MNNKINDGGPAFPETCNNQIIPGMKLRDYFAAKAMQGFLNLFASENKWPEDKHFRMLASESYIMADAMLKAREK